jgi:acyl-coenzyme A synthetase/AMP-(fatty) acid ligase
MKGGTTNANPNSKDRRLKRRRPYTYAYITKKEETKTQGKAYYSDTRNKGTRNNRTLDEG